MVTTAAAVDLIVQAPAAFRDLLHDASGEEAAPDLDWNVTGYVCHVADNLRIWAERLVSAAESPIEVTPYDAEGLAAARRYNSLPLSGALWSLAEAARSWEAAWRSGRPTRVLVHPDRGSITAEDIAHTNGHDVFHHEHDIRRCLRGLAG